MTLEIKKSRVLYRGPIFKIRKDDLLLPNGRVSQIDIVDHRDSVTMIPLDQEGMIWFISQYRHPIHKELLELPAGVIEEGETPEICAQREIREEIGMAANKLDRIGGFYLAPGYSSEYMHVFLATSLHPDPLQCDTDEIIKVVKLPVMEAFRLAKTGQLQDSKSLVGLFWSYSYLLERGLI